MHSAKKSYMPDFLSLPEDILLDIVSRLNDRHRCRVELASNRLCCAMSRYNSTWPRKKLLDHPSKIMPLSPDNFRWFQKRILRYSHIVCDTSQEIMLSPRIYPARRGFKKRDASRMVQPLLPSLLADCAPSAELSLMVQSNEGTRFLKMASGLIPQGAGPELLSFSANLRLHLTELSLRLDHRESGVGLLEALNMLTALQKLEIGFLQSGPSWLPHHYSLAGKRLGLKLPHLLSFGMYGFSHGEFVLTCPKLAEAKFKATACLDIEVKDATLASLELLKCHFVTFSPKEQLQDLRSLHVLECGETGRSLFDDVNHVRHLQTLVYKYFPETCMPRSFPQSLQTLQLAPFKWTGDVPREVKELRELKHLHFVPFAWEVTQPWQEKKRGRGGRKCMQPSADIASIVSLEDLQLGNCRYKRTGNGPLERVWRT